jgi:hypothetical protein
MATLLNRRSVEALNRLGDIMLPKNGEFPSFSETGCVEHVDKILEMAPPDDVKSLNGLLYILSFKPAFVLRWIVGKIENHDNLPEFLAAIFRELDFGLRGVIFTLYYSGETGTSYKGKTVNEIIRFEINRLPVAIEKTAQPV